MRCLGIVLLCLPSVAHASDELAAAALARTQLQIVYDGSYFALEYPGGDVPDHLGVCTDVVVRAYRALGIDLQVLVHEDMAAHFDAYPKLWQLAGPDKNIDHRRVPNLETFFTRQGAALAPSADPASYAPGDIVSWRLADGLPHIGIVGPNRDASSGRPLVVHNIGQGPIEDDVLFRYPITGHFRFAPTRSAADRE